MSIHDITREMKHMEPHEKVLEKATTRKMNLFEGITLRPLPLLSLAAIVLPALFLILMSLSPNVLSALQRDRGALTQGQWWRLLSPMLVDSDGWWQFLFVSLGFVCIGILVEHLFGWWRWLLLFLAGGLVGELAGYAWQPYGGGTSIALFGLLGGLLMLLLRRDGPVQVIASLYALAVVTVLTCEAVVTSVGGTTIVGIVAAAILCWLLIQLFILLLRRQTAPRTLAYFIASVALLGAIVLTAFRDHHGPALLAGMCMGALLVWLDPTFNRI
jgi:membrane associated rhomboid family serine protease